MLTYPPQAATTDLPIPAPTPRTPRNENKSFRQALDAVIAAQGDWVCILDPKLLTGKTYQAKSIAFHGAAKARGIKVGTTNQHGYFYCRLRKPGEKVVAA